MSSADGCARQSDSLTEIEPARRRRIVRVQVVLVSILAAAVLIPRSANIARIHGTHQDDGGHIYRGLLFWHRAIPPDIELNDPPLAQAITALPVLGAPELKGAGSPLEIERRISTRSLVRIAIFKSILFVPAVTLIFLWVAELYGFEAGWLAVAMVLIDPTLAAHVGLPTTDGLSTEGIIVAMYLMCRCMKSPGIWSGVSAGIAIAAAMSMKHTALLMPIVGVVMAIIGIGARWRGGNSTKWDLGRKTKLVVRAVGLVSLAGVTCLFFIWAFTLFDIRKPYLSLLWRVNPPAWAAHVSRMRLPAGLYVASIMETLAHNRVGHPAILFGKISSQGWWYYFPALATMKVPLGFFVVFALSFVSLKRVRFNWRELSIVVPLAAWTALLMSSRINIGFRHFLPAYLFYLMWAARAVSGAANWMRVVAWGGVIWAAVHVSTYYPDLLSYVNRDIDRVWMDMDDSNVDWGQGAKEIGRWVDSHVPPGRRVTLIFFGHGDRPDWLGTRVVSLHLSWDLPKHGILIITPNCLSAQYMKYDKYAVLRQYEPTAIIGHSMLVFDLDVVTGGKGMEWNLSGPPSRAATRPSEGGD